MQGGSNTEMALQLLLLVLLVLLLLFRHRSLKVSEMCQHCCSCGLQFRVACPAGQLLLVLLPLALCCITAPSSCRTQRRQQQQRPRHL